MIWIVIVFILTAMALLAIYGLLRGSFQHPGDLAETLERLHPINVASLQHLASRREDEFLRRQLSDREYRQLRNMRAKALRSYYSNALQNCSLLLAYGGALASHADPAHLQFGRELCRVTLQLRFALWCGLVGVFFSSFAPQLYLSQRQAFDLYRQLGLLLSSFTEQRAPGLQLVVSRQFSL